MNEIYFSTDCETDGPIPGPNSMLSFGSAAFSPDGKLLSTFSANLNTLPGASPNPETAAWWEKNKQAYEATRKDCQDPKQAMEKFVAWVNTISDKNRAKPVFVAYPAGFDFTWIYQYIVLFGLKSPFSFSACDMKTVAMVVLGCGYREATKRNFPRSWFPKDAPHTHVGLDDAIEQGHIFCAMLRAARERMPR